MNRDTFVQTSAIAIGATTLFFAGWALFRPRSLASSMRVSPRHAHLLGYRDLASAALLLTNPTPLTFAVRAAADAMDATTMASRRPGVAAGAALFGAWAVLAGTLAAGDGGAAPRRPASLQQPAGWDVW